MKYGKIDREPAGIVRQKKDLDLIEKIKSGIEKSGIRRSTVCSTAKERIYPSRVSQKKEGSRLPLFIVKKQSKNFKNNEETNISPKTVAATVADDSIWDTYKMRPPGWMIMETEIGVAEGGKRKLGQDSDTGNRNNESYKFQTFANITKESQIYMAQIEQMWKLEAFGDEKALEAFQKSLTVDKEGRCVVSWPWKNQEIAPAKGYGLAWRRLRTTIRRLKKSPELLECYDEYIKILFEEGIIERIKNQNETWRGSIRRISKDEDPSLNECLHRGPVMMPSLIGILLRARQGRYLVITDVEKAFLQVSLRREDRDIIRFLWLKDKTKEVSHENLATYRFMRVPFGVVSSPFLLTVVIRHLLNEESSKLSTEVAKNLYADNVLTAESELESNRKAQEAKDLFKKAKMHLREFHTNYDIEVNREREITKTTTELLGIERNNIKNEFIWRWKIPEKAVRTTARYCNFMLLFTIHWDYYVRLYSHGNCWFKTYGRRVRPGMRN
uniref:Reverse transcriptase domain-containing protein n=1 Tax=Loa loa TaxID=7209 RepID=A0A1I7VSX5_LOALO